MHAPFPPSSERDRTPARWHRFAPKWLDDFDLSNGTLTVRATGSQARIDPRLFLEIFAWIRFHLVTRSVALLHRVSSGTPDLSIAFVPEHPRRWYMIRTVMAWGSIRIAQTAASADVIMQFVDATWVDAVTAPGFEAINGRCRDISKSHVARVFETVFGVPLALDPAATTGLAVEKSETNSLHDGRIVTCPRPAVAGCHYERLIETGDAVHCEDLRTHCVDGRPVVVWRKLRAKTDCFRSIANVRVDQLTPDSAFSADELSRVSEFLDRIGLDWGTLDILRDVRSGQIYIVDVNTTDVGPVLVLSFADKVRTCRLLARELRAMIERRRASACIPARTAA